MRLSRILLILAATLLLLSAVDRPRIDIPALEINTTITPSNTPGPFQLLRKPSGTWYQYTVTIRSESDMRTHPIDLFLAPGEKREEKAKVGDLDVVVNARLATSLERAETKVTVSRNGKTLHRQSTSVSLPRRQ